jgi:4a-hydroxytetrahydrobiopterin dehydratase
VGEGYPSGWSERDGALERTVEFPTFMDGIAFVNRVAALAEEANHHPDIAIHYRTVTLRLWTHTAQAITERDVRLAERIDQLLG